MKLFILLVLIGTLIVSGLSAMIAAASPPDVKFSNECVDCHDLSDFAGTPPAEIAALLEEIVNGSVKHKLVLTLSQSEIAAMAKYLAAQ